jgi:hypothetical protein
MPDSMEITISINLEMLGVKKITNVIIIIIIIIIIITPWL